MAKLADIASEVRVILKVLAVSAVVVTVVFLIFQGISYYIALTKPPTPPDKKFGQLEQVIFPAQTQNNYTFRVNTLSGKLETLPDRIKVFKVKETIASLGALEKVRGLLTAQGFSNGEAKISDSAYQWSNTRSSSTIQYDLVTSKFRISSNFLTEPLPPRLSGNAATTDGAYQAAASFLSSVGVDTGDLDPKKAKAVYLAIRNGQLLEADSQNNAQFVKINLFQKDINEKGIYYPSYSESPSYFILQSEGGSPKIVDANYNFQTPDLTTFGEYPIKTAESAYEDLKRGNAFIIVQGDANGPLDVTKMTLGYYMGIQSQEYFLPVVVFEGGSFKGYVNALAN